MPQRLTAYLRQRLTGHERSINQRKAVCSTYRLIRKKKACWSPHGIVIYYVKREKIIGEMSRTKYFYSYYITSFFHFAKKKKNCYFSVIKCWFYCLLWKSKNEIPLEYWYYNGFSISRPIEKKIHVLKWDWWGLLKIKASWTCINRALCTISIIVTSIYAVIFERV